MIAEFIGLHRRDLKWLAPDGFDCTEMCEWSYIGGFRSQLPWTLHGWILDDDSHCMIVTEYYMRFFFPDGLPCMRA